MRSPSFALRNHPFALKNQWLNGLRLYPRTERSQDEELHLFCFWGEGTIAHHGYLPDWLFWPAHAINIVGTQESTSRCFVEALSKLIGVTVDAPGR